MPRYVHEAIFRILAVYVVVMHLWSNVSNLLFTGYLLLYLCISVYATKKLNRFIAVKSFSGIFVFSVAVGLLLLRQSIGTVVSFNVIMFCCAVVEIFMSAVSTLVLMFKKDSVIDDIDAVRRYITIMIPYVSFSLLAYVLYLICIGGTALFIKQAVACAISTYIVYLVCEKELNRLHEQSSDRTANDNGDCD